MTLVRCPDGHTALPRRASPVPGLSYSLCPGKHNEPRQRQYGRPATGPPLCKGSCRRTPTEGLAEYRRWQPVLPVRCPDGQAVLPHPVKQPSKMMQSAPQSPLHGFAMLSPLCTRGAAVLPHRATEPGPVVSRAAKTAPLCKGSCRRTPTEGLRERLWSGSQATMPRSIQRKNYEIFVAFLFALCYYHIK